MNNNYGSISRHLHLINVLREDICRALPYAYNNDSSYSISLIKSKQIKQHIDSVINELLSYKSETV